MKKRILGIIALVISIIFTGTIKVNAATSITTNNSVSKADDSNSYYITNQATITVNGVESHDSFNAYKILDAYYNADANSISYDFTSDFKRFLEQSSTYNDLTIDGYTKLTSGDIESGSNKTTSTLDKLVSAYAGYIKTNNVNKTQMNVSATTASITADSGSYLILPTVTSRVYSVMVGNIAFKAVSGEWVLDDATIVAKVSDASIKKGIGSSKYTANSFTIGKEFSYVLTATVPLYPTNATNKIYTITDTMSAGISFNGLESLTMTDGEKTLTTTTDGNIVNEDGQVVATATFANQVLTININVDNVAATILTINYKAKLNNGAIIGSTGNKNEVQLTYSNDPYGTSTKTTEIDEGTSTTAYTYGIEILKYAKGNSNETLNGAEFEIYKDAELTELVGTFTTNNSGKAFFRGIAEGTYYIKETKAPEGYTTLKNPIRINLDVEDSSLVEGDEEGYYKFEIENEKVVSLPFTGGTGTIFFTLFGLSIIGVSYYLAVKYYKRNQKA